MAVMKKAKYSFPRKCGNFDAIINYLALMAYMNESCYSYCDAKIFVRPCYLIHKFGRLLNDECLKVNVSEQLH